MIGVERVVVMDFGRYSGLILVMLCFHFLIMPLSYACVEGSSKVVVPAVVGKDRGRLVTISVKVTNGTGNVYTEIHPITGAYTQSSELSAVKAAFDYLNMSNSDCDVYFDVEGVSGAYVDGPSAGAAMALGLVSALTGREPRSDALVTGTINDEGVIGPIGGLIEKAKATRVLGYDYLLTSLDDPRDVLLTSFIEDRYGIRLVNVRNLTDLCNKMFSNDTLDIPTYNPTHTVVDGVGRYETSGLDDFRMIAVTMLAEFDDGISRELNEVSNRSELYKILSYYKEETPLIRTLIEHGYLYTAANKVFTMSIDVRYLLGLYKGFDLNEEIKATRSCLSSLDIHGKRDDNWDWIAGAEMRITWANDTVSQVSEQVASIDTDEEEYMLYNTVLRAKAWCTVARYLNIRSNGTPVNESLLRDLAKMRLNHLASEFAKTSITSKDAEQHYLYAQQDYEEGKYAASLFESCYALAFYKSYRDETTEKREPITPFTPKTRWGQLFYSQFLYLNRTGDRSAETLYLLAKCMEETTDEINDVFDKHAQPVDVTGGNATGQLLKFPFEFDVRANIPLLRGLLFLCSLVSLYVVLRSLNREG